MADRYPNEPGFYAHAPETSAAAAESVAKDAKSLEAKILVAIREAGAKGLTGDEVAEKVGLPNPYQSRPRLSGLRARKAIMDSGMRRINASGRRAAVWVAAPATEGAHG